MKLCWEEKPESRPSFSSLLVSTGNMVTEEYKKVPEAPMLLLLLLFICHLQSWLLVCVSVTSSWLRTSCEANRQLLFDPKLLRIKTDRTSQMVDSRSIRINTLLFMLSIRWSDIHMSILTLRTGSPASQVDADLLEAGPSHSTYIIPINDITIEPPGGAALDAVRYEHIIYSPWITNSF